MKSRSSRKEVHGLIFQQISDAERFFSHNAFEAFMKYAGKKGFTDEQILTMAKSGMSGAELFTVVESGASAVQPPNSRERRSN